MRERIVSITYIVILSTCFLLALTGIIPYSLFFTIVIPVIIAYLAYYMIVFTRQRDSERREREDKLQEIEEKREANPEKPKYSWDIARMRLESYFDRNLSRSRSIFWISIAVMAGGFGIIIWCLLMSVQKPEVVTLTYMCALTGVITEFIGGTFMLVYRSTINQSSQNMEVLERINQVGMAIQIIESIPESEKALRNEARVEVTKLLLKM